LHYVQELQSTVLCFSHGTIYKIEDEKIEADPEEVGVVNEGILAAEWAPNEEQLALAGKDGKIFLFTPEFDVLAEDFIDDGDMSDKSAAIDQAQISWRDDSTIFATSYSFQESQCNKILVREASTLIVKKGPARADEKSVFSVSEQPLKNL